MGRTLKSVLLMKTVLLMKKKQQSSTLSYIEKKITRRSYICLSLHFSFESFICSDQIKENDKRSENFPI